MFPVYISKDEWYRLPMTTSTHERVRLGAEALDRKFPDWVGKIDLSRLDLAALDDCILAQLYGEFSNGKKKFSRRGRFFDSYLINRGFLVRPNTRRGPLLNWLDHTPRVRREYRDLTQAWRDLIVRRRIQMERGSRQFTKIDAR